MFSAVERDFACFLILGVERVCCVRALRAFVACCVLRVHGHETSSVARSNFQFSIEKNSFFRIFCKKKLPPLVSQITTLYQAPPPAKNAKNLLLHRSFSKKVISQAPRPPPAPAVEGDLEATNVLRVLHALRALRVLRAVRALRALCALRKRIASDKLTFALPPAKLRNLEKRRARAPLFKFVVRSQGVV